MIDNYLQVLEDSSRQKNMVLDQILEASKKQAELLKQEALDLEAFDAYVDEKDALVDQLTKLDDGFEALYDKVREELLQNKSLYAEQIGRLQELISTITEKSVAIQALEARNRDMVTAHFKNERSRLGQNRKSSQAVYGYYQNVNKVIKEDRTSVDFKQ